MNSKDEDDDDAIMVTKEDNTINEQPPPLPFVTTSHILNQLNTQLQLLSGGTEALQQQQQPQQQQQQQQKPRFELQKRLPDGSAIPASESDLRASDLQTKLQQSAKFVSLLTNDQDKLKWAHQQRTIGNAYYKHGDYVSAMDIYLTCLVVKDNVDGNVDNVDNDDNHYGQEFTTEIYLPVLNNLASCTLQLSMYKKTILFCSIGLEREAQVNNYYLEETSSTSTSSRLFLAKLYFKRAKAYRLTGEYPMARKDLTIARNYTLGLGDTNTNTSSTVMMMSVYEQAMAKELVNLEMAEREGQKNFMRVQKGIQKALNVNNNKSATTDPDLSSQNNGLYPEPRRRKYSALRVQKTTTTTTTPVNSQNTNTKEPLEPPKKHPLWSYSEYYWAVVARVAETLLIWLGDEDVIQNQKQQQQVKQEQRTKKD
jgi:tetratricopeptide (TPR) repeat protein